MFFKIDKVEKVVEELIAMLELTINRQDYKIVSCSVKFKLDRRLAT